MSSSANLTGGDLVSAFYNRGSPKIHARGLYYVIKFRCEFEDETMTIENQTIQVTKDSVNDQENPIQRNTELSLKLALAAAHTAAENGGTDVAVLDMTDQSAMFDYFVIATGSSRRQLHAMSEEIDRKLEEDLNDKRMNIDGYDESRWIVLDYTTVIVHLFDEETRVFYSIEALWGDAKRIDLTETLKDIESA